MRRQWRSTQIGADFTIRAEVSGNILKNGMGVGIPGTGMVGLHIAAALGAVCGRSSYGLEVLHDLDEASIANAKRMVEEKAVTVALAETDHKLYVKAIVEGSCGHCASAVIEDDHDNIVETCFDQKVLSGGCANRETLCDDTRSTLDYHLTVEEIYRFATTVD